MKARLLLLQDDKEKLVDKILSLDEENEKLRKENETLRKEIDHLKDRSPHKTEKHPPQKNARQRSKPPHQWGRKAGHVGCTRRKPEHIDREVKQTLKTCPDCHHRLGEAVETTEHIQEDIIPAQVEVTRYVRHRYWCRHCRVVVTAPYAPDEVPCGYLGARTLTSMVLLKFYHGLPGNKICDIFRDFCGLKVSEGAVAQALQRLARYLQVESEVIVKAIREASYKHVDETGWKINSVKHWLWAFVHEHWASYLIDRSRGSQVPKEVLGHPFQGTMITDFYGAYNRMKGNKQKCFVHLRREIRRCRGNDPPQSFRIPEKKLKRILSDALRLDERRSQMARLLFRRRVRRIQKRFLDFACGTYANKDWQRLSKRLLKYEKELFTFLDVPGLPNHNNAAERAIRPHVIIRNRSFQNRTDKGARAHSILTSLIHTLHLQNRSPVSSLQQAYLLHRQGHTKPSLFSFPNSSR
jgi:transposase